MKKIERISRNIQADKELVKAIEGTNYYSIDNFISDASDYIEATKAGRMLCVIPHVSRSGMSRVIKFHSWQPGKRGYYRQYNGLFKALGYRESRDRSGFTISGCGMDVVFHTNYTNIHRLARLGFISRAVCESLAQNTPVVL